MKLASTLTDLRDNLRAELGNTRVTLNAPDLNVPGYLLVFQHLEDISLCGSIAEARVDVWCVVGDTDETRALTSLDGLLAELLGAFDRLGLPVADRIDADLFLPPSGGTPHPALVVPTSVTTQED